MWLLNHSQVNEVYKKKKKTPIDITQQSRFGTSRAKVTDQSQAVLEKNLDHKFGSCKRLVKQKKKKKNKTV
jgi:methylphosphotriester-DNA--protein-cysteine methyltransferase